MGEVTNFPYGLSSFGTVLPSSIGMQSGATFFVDPVNGNDGNDGGSPVTAFKTLPIAYAACTAAKGDTVYLISNGAASGTARLTSLLTWEKANTHLIGVCAPSQLSQRARVSDPSAQATTFPELFKLNAAGCRIENIQFFQNNSTDEDTICFEVGSAAVSCYIANCAISGMGNLTPAARAGSMTLKLVGAENVFDQCTIGIDTITRGANSEIVIAGTGASGAARNIFRNCYFPTYTSSASHLWVSAAASTFDRWILFDNCTFMNAIQSGSTTMTSVMSITGTGSPAGMVLLKNSVEFGATYWVGADTSKVMLATSNGAADSKLFGIARTADLP